MSGEDLEYEIQKALKLLATGADHVHGATGTALVLRGLAVRIVSSGRLMLTALGRASVSP